MNSNNIENKSRYDNNVKLTTLYNDQEVSNETKDPELHLSKGDNADDCKNDKTIDELIDSLPDSFEDIRIIIKNEIIPRILKLDSFYIDYYIDEIKKKTGITKQVIREEIEALRKIQDADESLGLEDDEDEEPDEEVIQMSEEISNDPLLFLHRIDSVNSLGIINERNLIGITFLTIDSRLLPMGLSGSHALAVNTAGHYGAGKSTALALCILLNPKKALHVISKGSAKSMYYIPGGLIHKALIVNEAFSFKSNNSDDAELAYIVRTLLSEGYVIYQYPVWIDDRKVTKTVKMKGPTSLVTTSVYDQLQAELQDRMFTVHPNASARQTDDILAIESDIAAGNINPVDQKVIQAWKYFHGSLEPREVIIPFAPEIKKLLTSKGILPVTARRAYKRVLSAIKTITLLYQKQREEDDAGRLIAEICDYAMAYQLVDEPFRESLDDSKFTDRRLRVIQDHGLITPRELAKVEGVTGPAINDWAKKWIKNGVLCWCDENGEVFTDEKKLKKARSTGKLYYKVMNLCNLPTPFQLTGDPSWDVDGDLYELYDLKLYPPNRNNDLLSDDLGYTEDLNTYPDSYIDDNVEDSDESESGVKVLRTIPHEEVMKKIRESKNYHEESDPNDPETIKLYNELEQFLTLEETSNPNNECNSSLSDGIITI